MDFLNRITGLFPSSETSESVIRRMLTEQSGQGLSGRLQEHPEDLPVVLRVFATMSSERQDSNRLPRQLSDTLKSLEREDRQQAERVDSTGRASLLPSRKDIIVQLVEAGNADCVSWYLSERYGNSTKEALGALITEEAPRLVKALNTHGKAMWEVLTDRMNEDHRAQLIDQLAEQGDLDSLHYCVRYSKERGRALSQALLNPAISEEQLRALMASFPEDGEDLYSPNAFLTALTAGLEKAPERVPVLLAALPSGTALESALSWWREAKQEEGWSEDPERRPVYLRMAELSGTLMRDRREAEPPWWRMHVFNVIMLSADQDLLDCFQQACGEELWTSLWAPGGLGEFYGGPINTALRYKDQAERLVFAVKNCPEGMLQSLFSHEEAGMRQLDVICKAASLEACREILTLLPKHIVSDYWGPDDAGRGPLHRGPAPSAVQIEQIQELCPDAKREQLFAQDKFGRSPLFYWCAQPHREMEASLAACSEELRVALWQADKQGQSPLHYALLQDVTYPQKLPWEQIPEEAYPLVWGADSEGRTLTHFACMGGYRLDIISQCCPKEYQTLQWQEDSHGLNPVLFAMAQPPKPRGGFGGVLERPSPAPDYLPMAPAELREDLRRGVDDRGFSGLHLLMLRAPKQDHVKEWIQHLGNDALEKRTAEGMRPLDLHVMLGGDPELIPLLHPDYDHADPSLRDFIDAYSADEDTYWELKEGLFQRLAERHPLWAKGEQALPEALELLKVLGQQDSYDSTLGSLINNVYRMNQELPLTVDTLHLILKLLTEHPQEATAIFLMLQTCANVDDIETAVRRSKDLLGQLTRAQVMRDRSKAELAHEVLKAQDAPETYLIQALRYLERTEIELSSKTLPRLYDTAATGSPAVRQQALLAAAAVNGDPYSATHKAALLEVLEEHASPAALDALAQCRYSLDTATDKQVLEAAMHLASESEDVNLRCSAAYLLSVFPHEDALSLAASVVASKDWELFESGITGESELSTIGHFMAYSHRPRFERSRTRMQRMLAERLLELKRAEHQETIAERLALFHEDPGSSIQLRMIDRAVRSMTDNTRYLSFPLFYPKGRCFFRGVGCRNAEDLRKAVLAEIQMAGSGSSDLTLYEDAGSGTWAKTRQIFLGSSLDFVLHGYFEEGGMLMIVPSDDINESQMRLQLRYEKERGEVNAVLYDRVRQHQISQLFLDRELQPTIEQDRQLAARRKGEGSQAWKAKERLERVAARRFSEPRAHSETSLSERVSYFDPKGSLGHQVRTRMQELGLEECSLDEVVDENLERHIGRSILLEQMSEHNPLHACLKSSCHVPLPRYVYKHVSEF